MSLHRTIHMGLLVKTVLPYALLAVVGVGGIGAWAFGGVGPQPVPSDSTTVTKAVTVIGVTLIGAAIGWAAGRYVRRTTGKHGA